MTTLPQTTQPRLPRPNGATAIAAPQVAPVGSPLVLAGNQAAPMSPADVWRVIRSNLWLILTSLVVFGIAGFFVNMYLANNHARYTARGFVQVQPPNLSDPLGVTRQQVMDNTSLSYKQRTQAQLLQSDGLFTRVLQNRNNNIWQTEWIKQYLRPDATGAMVLDLGRAKRGLESIVRVSPIPESELISITVSYKHPPDTRIILQDIVDTHLREDQDRARRRLEENTRGLNVMRENYETRVRTATQRANAKIAKLSIDGLGVPGRLSSSELQLAERVRAQMEIERNTQMVRNMLENAMAQIQQGMELPIVEQMVNASPEVLRLRSMITDFDIQLAAMPAQGPQNRYREELRARRNAAAAELENLRNELRLREQDAYLSQLQAQFASNQQSLEAINQQVNQLKAELAELNAEMNEYLMDKSEEEAYREMLKEVRRQIDTISHQTRQEVSGLQWAGRPETPETPSFPNLRMSMALALFLGLALSLGIAFLREFLDTSIRSPRDIQRVGQMNLLGMINHQDDDPQAAGAALPTVIYNAPTSMLAEQLRQVRTRLQHAASLETTRSILITSPGPGDGKTVVASNLAAGLALNGRRILLVDANFRRPEIHKLFGLTNEAGLSTVLGDMESFGSTVRATNVPNLDVLTSGPKPVNPTELMESRLLIDFIERALEEYDHVLFDSGPLLFVSETVALAPRVDGVVTVVRARSNTRGLLQRMRDTLRQLKVEHIGVVLNAVRAQAGGYYNRNIKTYYEYQNGVKTS